MPHSDSELQKPRRETSLNMRDRVLAFDWCKTTLGPMKTWPQSLRFAVDLCLSSNFPMFVWWGPDLINIHNDAYAPVLGKRHPDALGKPAREIWADIWPGIGDDVDRVINEGIPIVRERVRFIMERNGYPEEAYFTYSHSPIPDGRGGIGGLFQVCNEETIHVRAEARDRFLLSLDEAIRPLSNPAEITATYARLLGEHLQVDRCAYADIDEDQDSFTLTGDFTRGVPSIVGRYRLSDFGDEVLRLNRADKPYIANDVEDHVPPLGNLEAYRAANIRAVISVPLYKNGTFRAGMAVHQKVPRVWRTDEVDLLKHVASRCWESIERARTETALRESEEFHRFASEAGRTGSWYLDLRSDECVLSAMMAELMAFPRGQTRASAEEWRGRVDPSDRPALDKAIRRCIEHDAPLDIEFRIAINDGPDRWLYSRGGAHRDASGNAIRLHGASVDITDRKRAEEDLHRSQARFGAALTIAKLGTFEWNLLTNEVVLDERSREIFGFAVGEGAYAQEIFDRIDPNDFERVFAQARASIRDLSRLETEYRIVLPDGRIRTIVSISDAEPGTNTKAERLIGVFSDITERKQVEVALRENATRFRRLMEQAPFSVQVLAPDGRTVSVNRAWEDLWGLTLDKIQDYNVLTDPQLEGKGILPFLRRAFAGEVVELPLIAYDPDETLPDRTHNENSRRWVSGVAYPLQSDDGRVWEVVLVHRDLTARKDAEERERKLTEETVAANAKFRAVFDQSSVFAGIMKLDGTVIEANRICLEACGFQSEQVLGRKFWETPWWRESKEVQAKVQAGAQQAAAGTPYREVLPYHWNDGTPRIVDLTIFPIRDEQDRIIFLHPSGVDITEREQSESELRKSEARFRSVFTNNMTAMGIAKKTGVMSDANEALLRLIGYTRHELESGQLDWQILTPSSFENLDRNAFDQIERNTVCWPYEKEVIHKAGHRVPILFGGGRLDDITGDIVFFVVDLSERKATEQALARAKEELERNNRELESIVAERTAKLRETIGELEAFSYSISHDMRSPLRAMQGFSQALVDEYSDRLDDDGRDLLLRIERGARRLDLLIRDVLAYSRVAKGEFDLHPVDLDILIPEIIHSFNYESARITIPHPLPQVFGHEPLITQIISNLVGNAVKFATPGVTPEVRIHGEPFDGMVRIWVEDNGIGIDPSHFKQIFVIFGRVYAEKQFPGTGIGLAIVKKAVERLGGQIGLESELGKGSRFWFTLKRLP